MKNYFKMLPILFWSVINGQVINCDNIAMISWSNLDYYSVIQFNSPARSLIIVNNTPTEVWNILVKNKL